jgi:sn-glycerol 3-phosphate transport system substrate-binding protein
VTTSEGTQMEPTEPTLAPVRSGRAPLRLAVAAVAAGIVLAACGSPPESGSSGSGGGRTTGTQAEEVSIGECPLDALEEASGPIEVDLWYGGLGGDTQATMEEMAEAFNASQDQIVVRANNQGRSYEEVLRKYEGASSQPSQLPQILYVEDTALGQMVDKGQVLPAQACMEADDYDLTQILPTARTSFSVDGVLYPGYMNVSTPVLYYNKSIFVKAGLDPDDPPETLEEVYEAAKVIKDAGLATKPFSFKVNRWFMENWLSGVGIDSVNNDNGRTAPPTEAEFNTPEAVEILTLLKKMNDEGLLNPFASTEGSIDHFLALLPPEGGVAQSAMLVETSTASTTIASVVSGQLTAAEAGIDFDESVVDRAAIVPGGAPYPGLNSGGKVNAGGGAFYILNTSDPAQQAASWKFLRFMLEPENARTWHIKGGYLPIVKSVLEDDEVEAFWSDTMAGVIVKPAVDQLRDADPDQAGPLMGPYVPFADALQGAMEKVLLSGSDPAAELEKAEKAVNDALADYNDE